MLWPEIIHALAHDSILRVCNNLLIEEFCPHTCIIKIHYPEDWKEHLPHMKI